MAHNFQCPKLPFLSRVVLGEYCKTTQVKVLLPAHLEARKQKKRKNLGESNWHNLTTKTKQVKVLLSAHLEARKHKKEEKN